MPEINKEQTPQGATENTNQEISPELIAKMSPEQVAKYVADAKEAIKAATQRNQQVAEERKRVEQEKKVMEDRLSELLETQKQLLEKLSNANAPAQKQEDLTAAFLDNPTQFMGNILKKNEELEKRITELQEAITTIPIKLEYEKKINEIKNKFPYVDEIKLEQWFKQKSDDYPVDDNTLEQAAREISEAEIKKLDTILEQRKKEQEEKDKKAISQVQGGIAASMPQPESIADLHPIDREQTIAEYIKKLKSI